jgi:hypothetical protein
VPSPTGNHAGGADDDGPSEPLTGLVEVPPHAPPWWAPFTLAAFLALVVCTNIANVVWARWANNHPEGLIALSSRQRYLVLAVAGGISPFWYIVIGAGRIAAAFLVCHLVGRAYREQALSWFTRYLGMSRSSINTFNDGFAKAEIGLVPFFAGSNIVGVLTGIHRTPPLRLAVLLGVGIAGRLALMWWLAKAFESQLLDILGFLQRYQWWALGLSLLVVVAVNARNFRRGAGA